MATHMKRSSRFSFALKCVSLYTLLLVWVFVCHGGVEAQSPVAVGSTGVTVGGLSSGASASPAGGSGSAGGSGGSGGSGGAGDSGGSGGSGGAKSTSDAMGTNNADSGSQGRPTTPSSGAAGGGGNKKMMPSLKMKTEKSSKCSKSYMVHNLDMITIMCEPMYPNATYTLMPGNTPTFMWPTNEKCMANFSKCTPMKDMKAMMQKKMKGKKMMMMECMCAMEGTKKKAVLMLKADSKLDMKMVSCVWKAKDASQQIMSKASVGKIKATCAVSGASQAAISALWLLLACLASARFA